MGWWQTCPDLKRQGGIFYHCSSPTLCLCPLLRNLRKLSACWSLCVCIPISSQNFTIHFDLQLRLVWPTSTAISLVLSFVYVIQPRVRAAFLNANLSWGGAFIFTAAVVPLCCMISRCGLEVFLYCLLFALW